VSSDEPAPPGFKDYPFPPTRTFPEKLKLTPPSFIPQSLFPVHFSFLLLRLFFGPHASFPQISFHYRKGPGWQRGSSPLTLLLSDSPPPLTFLFSHPLFRDSPPFPHKVLVHWIFWQSLPRVIDLFSIGSPSSVFHHPLPRPYSNHPRRDCPLVPVLIGTLLSLWPRTFRLFLLLHNYFVSV